MKRRLAVVGVTVVVLMLGAGAISSVSQAAETGVSIRDFSFRPPDVSIGIGDTVTWTNDDPTDHTVTAAQPSGAFDSRTLVPGAKFSQTFSRAGTYTYFCKLHHNMVGRIRVIDPANPNPPPTTTPAPVTRDVSSTLTLSYDRAKGVFKGAVGAPEEGCREDRSISLMKKTKSGSRRIASASTREDGSWSVKAKGARGIYFAVAATKRSQASNGDTLSCLRASSRNIRVR